MTPEIIRAVPRRPRRRCRCGDRRGPRDRHDQARPTASPTVARTLDRSGLWAIQTPQVFRRDVLERALAQPHEILAAATDDASLVETMGGTVRLVESPRENLKVTTPDDLRLADLLLRSRR